MQILRLAPDEEQNLDRCSFAASPMAERIFLPVMLPHPGDLGALVHGMSGFQISLDAGGHLDGNASPLAGQLGTPWFIAGLVPQSGKSGANCTKRRFK